MPLPALLQNLRLPVVGAPMFIISTPELVIAQCKAGVIGAFPALNARPAARLESWLIQIKEALDAHNQRHPDRPAAPYAVNQIVHRSNDRLMHDLDLCVKHEVPVVISSLGARAEVNQAVQSYGGMTLHDVIHDPFAKKAIAKGADGLIAVAAGAGGHAGALSPFALVSEIRQWFDGPLLLSGAIATGRGILAAQTLGADLAYIGSAFIVAHEANAPPDYKQMVVECNAMDILYSDIFTGIHGNYLKPSVVRAGLDPQAMPAGHPGMADFGSRPQTPKAWKDIWGAGQGIGAVRKTASAGAIIARLEAEYHTALNSSPLTATFGQNRRI